MWTQAHCDWKKSSHGIRYRLAWTEVAVFSVLTLTNVRRGRPFDWSMAATFSGFARHGSHIGSVGVLGVSGAEQERGAVHEIRRQQSDGVVDAKRIPTAQHWKWQRFLSAVKEGRWEVRLYMTTMTTTTTMTKMAVWPIQATSLSVATTIDGSGFDACVIYARDKPPPTECRKDTHIRSALNCFPRWRVRAVKSQDLSRHIPLCRRRLSADQLCSVQRRFGTPGTGCCPESWESQPVTRRSRTDGPVLGLARSPFLQFSSKHRIIAQI